MTAEFLEIFAVIHAIRGLMQALVSGNRTGRMQVRRIHVWVTVMLKMVAEMS
jgi:hypothetical protein